MTVTAKARVLARYRDETTGPPHGSEVAMRCTTHGRFIVWCSPPAPPCRVKCPAACGPDDRSVVPALRETSGRPA